MHNETNAEEEFNSKSKYLSSLTKIILNDVCNIDF